jgi:hypothetical protein
VQYRIPTEWEFVNWWGVPKGLPQLPDQKKKLGKNLTYYNLYTITKNRLQLQKITIPIDQKTSLLLAS